MSKATAAKLAVLIFLAFIVCLPEFFPSNKVLQIQFYCVLFNSCDPMRWDGPEDEQICELYTNASRTELLCDAEAKKNWFVCEPQANLQSLFDNPMRSDVSVEVVLGLQIIEHSPLIVTMYGHFNHSGLHIETHLNFTLSGCCTRPQRDCTNPNTVTPPPSPPSHKPVTSAELTTKQSPAKTDSAVHPLCTSNRSQCFFHYAGSNILSTQTKGGRWWDFSTTMWLALILIVVLLVLLSVWVQVYKSRNPYHKPSVQVPVTAPQSKSFSKRRVKSLGDLPDVSISVWSSEDEELFMEKTLKDYSGAEKLHLVYQEMYKRGLSPIHEVSTTDMSLNEKAEERMPGGTVIEGSEESLDCPSMLVHAQSLPCLHHRGHPFNEDEEELTYTWIKDEK